MTLSEALQLVASSPASIRLENGTPVLVQGEVLPRVVLETLKRHRVEVIEALHLANRSPLVSAAMETFPGSTIRMLPDAEHAQIYNFPWKSNPLRFRHSTSIPATANNKQGAK